MSDAEIARIAAVAASVVKSMSGAGNADAVPTGEAGGENETGA